MSSFVAGIPMESTNKQEHINYDHSLLSSRPNFAKALHDFETFLIATQEDLQRKFRVLDEQRHNRKISRNVRTYLSLQNYLLQKHLHRLHEFHTEIATRVALIFANEGTYLLPLLISKLICFNNRGNFSGQ